MAVSTLQDLIEAASAAGGPSFPPSPKVKFGGIDPLGLRQINFDLMDEVLPGINNVARHIRPFTVATWAWRRAARVAEAQGHREIAVDVLQDFVARVEVIFVWSQFIRDSNADLPGRDVFGPLLKSEKYAFEGNEWEKRREVRRTSTAISSPINYGPALKTLGWLVPHDRQAGVMIASHAVAEALDAFESLLADHLKHPVFNHLGGLTVASADVAKWTEMWALENPTNAEKQFMKGALHGSGAPKARRAGMALVASVADRLTDRSLVTVRQSMCGPPANVAADDRTAHTAVLWKQVQRRQLFRLALEGMFYWLRNALIDGARSTTELVELFLVKTDLGPPGLTATEWLAALGNSDDPVELIGALNNCLHNPDRSGLEGAIARALAHVLRHGDDAVQIAEREDRLPLSRARKEAARWGDRPRSELVRHILESWILAQHVYWSVGRGLADARARGKSILRLKVILEENGWTLAPGATPGAAPVPAGDRLATVLSLAEESALISPSIT